jgi:hypothetical protein
MLLSGFIRTSFFMLIWHCYKTTPYLSCIHTLLYVSVEDGLSGELHHSGSPMFRQTLQLHSSRRKEKRWNEKSEDGNCIICRNFGKVFNIPHSNKQALTWKPIIYITQAMRTPEQEHPLDILQYTNRIKLMNINVLLLVSDNNEKLYCIVVTFLFRFR